MKRTILPVRFDIYCSEGIFFSNFMAFWQCLNFNYHLSSGIVRRPNFLEKSPTCFEIRWFKVGYFFNFCGLLRISELGIYSQNTIILFQYVDFWTKISLILFETIIKLTLMYKAKGHLISRCPFGVTISINMYQQFYLRISVLASKKR